MFYIDSTMSGLNIPNNTSSVSFFKLLSNILSYLKEENIFKYSSLNDQVVTANNGHSFNDEFTILEVSDGEKTIHSEIKYIDNNSFMLLSDISDLSTSKITIKLPKFNNPVSVIENTTVIDFPYDAKVELVDTNNHLNHIVYSKSSNSMKGRAFTSSNSRNYGGKGYSLFYSEYGLIFVYNYYGTPADRKGVVAFFSNVNSLEAAQLNNASNISGQDNIYYMVDAFLSSNDTFGTLMNNDSNNFSLCKRPSNIGLVYNNFLCAAGNITTALSGKSIMNIKDKTNNVLLFKTDISSNIFAAIKYD